MTRHSAYWVTAVLLVCTVAGAAPLSAAEKANRGEAEALPPCSPNAPAEIVVLSDVIQPKERIVPLGPNNFGDPGGASIGLNNFIHNSGNEPANIRYLWRIKKIGEGWIELDWMGTRNWKTWGDGFLSGATARFYRLVDAAGKSLPRIPDKNPETSYYDLSKAHHVLPLGRTRVLPPGAPGHPKGGWIANENEQRVYLEGKGPALELDDYVVFERSFTDVDVTTIDPRLEVKNVGHSWSESKASGKDAAGPTLRFSLVPHPQPVPEAMLDPGATCLRAEVPAGKHAMQQSAAYGGAADFWYGNLEPGRKYRFEAWMRQEGLGDGGRVTFGASDAYAAITTSFTVDGQWRRFTYDFVGPERSQSKKLMYNQISFTGPGMFWLDNARIFRYDSEADLKAACVPGRTNLQELIDSSPPAGPKGALRCWMGLSDDTMERLLSLHGGSDMDIRPSSVTLRGKRNHTIPEALNFCEAAGAAPGDRVTPWIIIQVTFSEEEYQALIEYLADPYDPAKDTPKSKPWAYRRFQQRGKGEPWTETFPRIFIEFGNENWHNRMMRDWIGFGRPGHVHSGGKEYGIFCQYFIDTMKKTPCWAARKLDDRIRFICGGNYTSSVAADGTISGYGPDAMANCPDAMGQGHATYVGAKWELKEGAVTDLTDEGFQKTLLAYELWAKGAMENQSKARIRLMELGRKPFDLVGYEGGPSGFLFSARPGKNTFPEEAVKTANLYGHSQCIGVAALDAWLDAYRLGWTWMCYLSWGEGEVNWTSHTVMGQGFRPYAGWQALALRNRYIWGDMLRVDIPSAPTLSYRTASKGAQPVARAVNLVSAYAFRDGSRYAVAILSRKLDGKHDGFDLGDGCTPVTLRLPFATAGKISLHALVGDPRKTNHEALNSKIESREVPAASLQKGVFVVNDKTGGAAGGLPPGQAFVYVFEEVQP